MSSADDLAALRPTLQALSADALKKPSIPVKIYVQEAENLARWCLADQGALTAAGLDWTLVTQLPQRIGALREAESQWFKSRFSREEAQQQWELKAPQAYALRDQLLRAMRYAYRREAALLSRVAAISEGTGHADMIQDLNDIAALGRDFAAPLHGIGVAAELLEQAASTAADMGELLAQVNGERADSSSARILRDQAYSLLKEAVDDIRDCGQYVFWDNPARFPGYISQHLRTFRARNAKADSPAEAPQQV